VKNPYLFVEPNKGAGLPPPIPALRLFQIPDAKNQSNASELGDTFVNTEVPDTVLSNPNYDLSLPAALVVGPNPPANSGLSPTFLDIPDFPYYGGKATDSRQHPYYHTEWLQKV